jgi:hypothetical protein
MIVEEVVNKLQLTVVAASKGLDTEIKGGYASDLLSNVMGFAAAGNVWVTMQAHQNIIAVASLAGLAAVIVAGGTEPEKDTAHKAETEGVILLATKLSCFEIVGQLYQLGVKGA